jgi:probable phosphoglycerate mutase
MGDWEGQMYRELEARYPQEFFAFWNTPHLFKSTSGGESYYDLQERVLPLLKTIIARHEGEEILIVTHAGTLKTILGHFEGRPLADLWKPPIIQPTALCKVVIEDNNPAIELYGDTSHYKR